MAGAAITGNFGIEFPLTVVPPQARGTRHIWYKPNHRSFGAFMRSEQMRNVTARVAHDISLRAADLAPVGDPSYDDHSGQLAAGFEVIKEAGYLKVGGNLRVKVEVVNNTPWAAANEFGSGRNKRHRMLGRAGGEFGDLKPLEGGER